MSISWEKILRMQERKRIITRTVWVGNRGWDNTHEKEFTLDWNTKTSSKLKKKRKLHGIDTSRLVDFGEKSKHKKTSPSSFSLGENQKQGHQQFSLALSKGSSLQCCKMPYKEIRMARNWRRPLVVAKRNRHPQSDDLWGTEAQELSLETDSPEVEPWNNYRPSWHLHCNLVPDLETDVPS